MPKIHDRPDPTPDGEEEPPAVYYREQAAATRHRLQHNPPTDPDLLEKLQRDLRHWEARVAAEDLGGHWEAGEGDRTLF